MYIKDKIHFGSVDIDFVYLGSRDYVNGLTLFEEMLKHFMMMEGLEHLRLTMIKQFKFNKFLRTHGQMNVLKVPAGQVRGFDHPLLKGANAQIDLITDEGRYVLVIFDRLTIEGPISISEYDRTRYILDQETLLNHTTRASFTRVEDIFDITRGIIEVNQQISNKELERVTGRAKSYWAYLRDYPFLTAAEVKGVTSVYFGKSSIVKVGERVFASRLLKFDGLARDLNAEVCFFV